MTKAIFINASPRKNWNTDQLLRQAVAGAESAGAEIRIYNLYDIGFTGCTSCFLCKIKDSKAHGVCIYPDNLYPVMEEIRDADVLVLGTPVYLGNMSAQLNLFWERLMFPNVSYSSYDMDRKMKKLKRIAMIVTMGATRDQMKQMGYDQHFAWYARQLGYTMGNQAAELLYACDTYQFSDYSKYEVSPDRADPVKKADHRKKEFPKDLEKAFDLGRRLCS